MKKLSREIWTSSFCFQKENPHFKLLLPLWLKEDEGALQQPWAGALPAIFTLFAEPRKWAAQGNVPRSDDLFYLS